MARSNIPEYGTFNLGKVEYTEFPQVSFDQAMIVDETLM